MNKVILAAFVLIIKYSLIALVINYVLRYYDVEAYFYEQSVIVYLFVYLPLAMGYEALINVFLEQFD